VENAPGAGAARESTAVQPDHHRTLASVLQAWREHVQDETVLAFLRRRSGGRRSRVVTTLRRGRPVGERVTRAGPGGGLDGRHEAILSARWRAVGNTLEYLDGLVHDAANFAGRRVGDRVLGANDQFRPRREVRSGDEERSLLHEGSAARHIRYLPFL